MEIRMRIIISWNTHLALDIEVIQEEQDLLNNSPISIEYCLILINKIPYHHDSRRSNQ